MPHEPKRRHSTARKGKRRASIKLTVASATTCSNCGKPIFSHQICKYCGFYKGKLVKQPKSPKKPSNEKSS